MYNYTKMNYTIREDGREVKNISNLSMILFTFNNIYKM